MHVRLYNFDFTYSINIEKMWKKELSYGKRKMLYEEGISEKLFEKIERKYNYMLNKLHPFLIEDEIYNLPLYKKELIHDILFKIIIRHIELYGEKRKMIETTYLLLEVFELFGIDFGIYVSTPFRKYYGEYCEKMMDFIKTEFEFELV